MRRTFILLLVLAGCDPDEPEGGGPFIDAAVGPVNLKITPGELVASTVVGTTGEDLHLTVTNDGVHLSGALEVSLTGTTDFAVVSEDCETLAPHNSCDLVLRFAPTSIGAIDGMLEVSSASGGRAIAQLHGTGKPVNDLRVERSQATDELGYVAVGHASTRTITFTVSTVGAVATGPLAVTFAHQNGFVVRSSTCTGQSIGPSTTCTVVVGFEPVVVGQRMTDLVIRGNPGGEIVNPVQGIGVATDNIVEVSPAAGAFPDTAVNATSATTTFTVTNTGSVATGALATTKTLGDANQFAIVSNACAGAVLPPAGTCTFAIAFAPTSTGQKITQFEITGAGNPSGVTLLGTAI